MAAADGGTDLRANHQGTGFVATVAVEHTTMMEICGPMGGPVASLPS